MKKAYKTPEAVISRFRAENIVIVSGVDALNTLTNSEGSYKVNSDNVTVVNEALNFVL